MRISGLSDRYSKIDNFVFSQVIRFCFLLRSLYFELLRNAMGNFLRGVPQDLSIYEALLQRAQEARAKLGLDDIPAPTTA